MNRGGPRPGAGRPAGERKLTLIVRLTKQTAQHLRATIPEKERSLWIEDLILAGLKKYQKSL